MNRLTALLVLILAGFGFNSHGQTTTGRSTENRFLFIVETSADTKKMADKARQSVAELVQIGLGGSMQDGDSFAIWTFNEELYTGKFPAETWTTNSANDVSKKADAFLKQQKFEKTPRLDKAIPRMQTVARSSPALTVIFLTSGTKPMNGTPFDREINEFYKAKYKESQKEKVPFLTMLLAQRGMILRYSVSPAIGDVKIAKPLPPLDAAPTNSVPQIIVPTNAPAKATAPVLVTNSQALIITPKGSVSVKTGDVDAKLEELSNARTQAVAVAAAQVPTAPRPVVTTPPPTNAAAVEPTPPSAEVASKAVEVQPAPTQTATTSSSPTNANASLAKPTPPATTPPATPAVPPVAATQAVVNAAPPVPAATQTVASTVAAVAPPQNSQPAPEATRSPETTAPPVTGEGEKPNVETAANEETKRPSNVVVAAAQNSDGSTPKGFLIGGILLVIAAVVVAYLLGRQSSKRSGPSLITDSMGRK